MTTPLQDESVTRAPLQILTDLLSEVNMQTTTSLERKTGYLPCLLFVLSFSYFSIFNTVSSAMTKDKLKTYAHTTIHKYFSR